MKAVHNPSPVHDSVVIRGNETACDLPAARVNLGNIPTVYSRWKLTPMERVRVLIQGDVGLYQWVTGYSFQPVKLDTRHPYPPFWFFAVTRATVKAIAVGDKALTWIRSFKPSPVRRSSQKIDFTVTHLPEDGLL